MSTFVNRVHRYSPHSNHAVNADMQKTLSDEKIFIAASSNTVWQFLTAPELIMTWMHSVQAVEMNPPFSEDAYDGTGAERRLIYKAGWTESHLFTDWVQYQILGYHSDEQSDVRHIGLFNLFPEEQGTEVQWLNYFELTPEQTDTEEINARLKSFRTNLIYLKWACENACQLVADMPLNLE